MNEDTKRMIEKTLKELYSENEILELGKKLLLYEAKRNQKKGEIDQKDANLRSVKKLLKEVVVLTFSKNEFFESIYSIRELLGIPSEGFSFEDSLAFKKWHDKYYIDDYKLLTEVLNQSSIIHSDPKPLLDYLRLHDFDLEWYEQAYYNETRFLIHVPSLGMYKNYLIEKPFVGIFEYILFNKIVLPNSRLVSEIEDDGGGRGDYILLGISKNATKRDVLAQWPLINLQQNSNKDSKKGKIRSSRNTVRALKVLAHNEETKKFLSDNALDKDKRAQYKSKRLYDNIDDDYDSKDGENILAQRRQHLSRVKKKLKNS